MESFLGEAQYLKIKLEQIKSATNNFDNNKVIGKGGFGKVYEGVLSHSKGQSMVAFKRLDRKHGQGNPEFLKEILMLSRYTHENLISLMGFCDEDGEKILVYEHAHHGSLDRHLSANTLTWLKRLKICLAAARGLCYLHDPKGTNQRVIHRDIKSSNILLDRNWNAKLSDMGLSKIGPANQQHSFLATNVVGTYGYIDPLYMETYFLTKESDVYSFGMVLFEALCGRLCFEYNHGNFRSFGPMWKKSYEEKKLDQIIFEDLKEQIHPSSLKIFSDIAYKCLQKSREERPKMSSVVEELEIAFHIQKTEGPIDFEEMIESEVAPHICESKEELQMLLYKGILVKGGKTWFSLNKNGEHCEMISASVCLTPILPTSSVYAYDDLEKSRFSVDYNAPLCWRFKMHVKPQFLSPDITYVVNLVFGFKYQNMDLLFLDYKLAEETYYSTSYIADKREDGWFMTELYQFTSVKRSADFDITFDCRGLPLIVEGIEFVPFETVDDQVLKDEELDKGFPVNNGEEWLSFTNDGKKCHGLPARMGLQKSEWKWRPSPESRFKEVALVTQQSFSLTCTSKMLSPQTKYACYLVYNIRIKNPNAAQVVEVSDRSFITQNGEYEPRHILLFLPETPKLNESAHNPLKRTKMEGVPQRRKDGWLEVHICKCQTDVSASEEALVDLYLNLKSFSRIIELTVQGIEFRVV